MVGHPHSCGGDDTIFECRDPNTHASRLGFVVGRATFVLAQPGDSPELSLVTDDGVVLPLDQVEELAVLADYANTVAHGHWPEYRVPWLNRTKSRPVSTSDIGRFRHWPLTRRASLV